MNTLTHLYHEFDTIARHLLRRLWQTPLLLDWVVSL